MRGTNKLYREIALQVHEKEKRLLARGARPDVVFMGEKEFQTCLYWSKVHMVTHDHHYTFFGMRVERVVQESYLAVGFELEVME